jgi:glycosyltransferase involved in cell wall biosynthesis
VSAAAGLPAAEQSGSGGAVIPGNMRILILHNEYQHRGGEDAVADAEAALLTSRGHEVYRFSRHNDEVGAMHRAQLAMQTVWSAPSAKTLRSLVDSFRPDVVHAHNTFPLISPSAYWAAAAAHVPVVQTLHNFRLLCPQAMFLREGRVCEDCLGRTPWRGAVRACYRGSRAQSTVLATSTILHRAVGTYRNKVTRYIALNEFCRGKFIEGGLPAERIVVKPNFVQAAAPSSHAREGFLFVGRLSAEKGISVLAQASARLPDTTIRVAGTGPESPAVSQCAGMQSLGALKVDEVRAEMQRACALLVPSIWYETFGLVVVEAFACGLPVIASRIGVLPGLVEDGVTGLLFEPGNAQDLAHKMAWAAAHPEEMALMGRRARARYEAEFTPDRNYAQLISIYQDAIHEVAALPPAISRG